MGADQYAIVAEDGNTRIIRLGTDANGIAEYRSKILRFMDVKNPESADYIISDKMPAELENLLSRLNRILLEPLKFKSGTRSVVIVPDETMHWIPWVALRKSENGDDSIGSEGIQTGGVDKIYSERSYLVSPSVFLVDTEAQVGAIKSYLVLTSASAVSNELIKAGLPDLFIEEQPVDLPAMRSVSDEAASIKKTFGPQVPGRLVSFPPGTADDMEIWVKEPLSDAPGTSLIHIAAHGIFNPNDPMASAIFLVGSDKGLLRPSDLASMDFSHAEIVSLSACQTGLSRVQAGGEAIGFVRGIFLAGAKRVLVTQWSVESEATKEFFSLYYKNLKLHKGFSAAYRVTVGEMSRRYNHPFYWSGVAMYSNVVD